MSSINTVKVFEPVYYHREYQNDIPQELRPSEENSWLDQSKRVAFAALPFFNLHKSLNFPLSVVMGGLRTYSSVTQLMETIGTRNVTDISFSMFQSTVSVIALAGTLFAHPLGMLISTANDLVIEISSLIHNLSAGEYKKAAENCLTTINNSLYLALFLNGGLELSIASLAMQILISLYHSQAEFGKGRYIEAASHMLMSFVRGHQLGRQVQVLQLQRQLESIKMSTKFVKISMENNPSSSEEFVVKVGETRKIHGVTFTNCEANHYDARITILENQKDRILLRIEPIRENIKDPFYTDDFIPSTGELFKKKSYYIETYWAGSPNLYKMGVIDAKSHTWYFFP